MPDARDGATPPPETIGRYRIVEQVSRGAAAESFKAFDPLLQRPLAIKLLRFGTQNPVATRERFYSEMRLVGTLAHPAIATLFDAGEAAGGFFLATEYVEGLALDAWIAAHPDAPLATRVQLLTYLAAALEHALAAGVPHLNLDPANVIVTPEGTVKVSGFGIARVLDEAGRESTAIGLRSRFLAPERLLRQRGDTRSDVFSLGALAREFLADEPRAAAVVARATQLDPSGRFATPRSFIDALSAATGVIGARPWARPEAPAGVTAEQLGGLEVAATAPGVPTFAADANKGEDVTSEISSAAPPPPAPAPDLAATIIRPRPAPNAEQEPAEAKTVLMSAVSPPPAPPAPPAETSEAKTVFMPAAALKAPEAGGRGPGAGGRGGAPRAVRNAAGLLVLAAALVALASAAALVAWRSPAVRDLIARWRASPPPADSRSSTPDAARPATPELPVERPAPPGPTGDPAADVAASPGGPAVATSATIRIVTTPAGARVSIDGRDRGASPLRVRDVAFGEHDLAVSLDGYEPQQQRVRLDADRAARTITFELVPVVAAPSTGSVAVTSDPEGAELFLDGNPAGTSPATLSNIPPGRHTVRAERSGFEPAMREIDVRAGETASVALRLSASAAPPPPAPPTPVDPIPFNQVQVKPRLLTGSPKPAYPRSAERLRLTGFVEIEWVVDEGGAVTDVKVVRSSSRLFEPEVVAWLRGLRYAPGRQAGRPVRVRISTRFNFAP